jgi:hypothetical protein
MGHQLRQLSAPDMAGLTRESTKLTTWSVNFAASCALESYMSPMSNMELRTSYVSTFKFVTYFYAMKLANCIQTVRSIREKYLKGLSELHEKNCIWKYSECDEWVYSFPFFTSYDAIKRWKDQVYALVTKNDSLPSVESPLVSDHIFVIYLFLVIQLTDRQFQIAENMKMMQKLLKLELELDNSIRPIDWLQHKDLPSAMILPLFGWNFLIIEQRPILKCDLCFRALGLWNYNTVDNAASDRHGYYSGLNSIDAEKEHRPYCPWINCDQAQITTMPTTRFNSRVPGKAICGWEFMLDMATIECKHLEEMYDLSPKAEQHRSQLHKEAQKLMKAAKSRLTEVLNGNWMNQNLSTPERIPVAEQVDETITPLSPSEKSPSVDNLPSRTVKVHIEEPQPLEPAVEIHDQNLGQINEPSANEPEAEVKSEVNEQTMSPDVDQDVHEDIIEHKPSVEITSEEQQGGVEILAQKSDLMKEALGQELQILDNIRDFAMPASPDSSLDVNLPTVPSPSEANMIKEAPIDQLQEEANAAELADYQGMDENEISAQVITTSATGADEMSSHVASYTETQMLSPAPSPGIVEGTLEVPFSIENEAKGEDDAQFTVPSPHEEKQPQIVDTSMDNLDDAINAQDHGDGLHDESVVGIEETELRQDEEAKSSLPAQVVADDSLEEFEDEPTIAEPQQTQLKPETDAEVTGLDEQGDLEAEDQAANEVLEEGQTLSAQGTEDVSAEDLIIDQTYHAHTPTSAIRDLDQFQDNETAEEQEIIEPTAASADDSAMYDATDDFGEFEPSHAIEEYDETAADTTAGDIAVVDTASPDASAGTVVEISEAMQAETQPNITDDKADFTMDENQMTSTPEYESVGLEEDGTQNNPPTTSTEVEEAGPMEMLSIEKDEVAVSPIPYDEEQYEEATFDDEVEDISLQSSTMPPATASAMDEQLEDYVDVESANGHDGEAEVGDNNMEESEHEGQVYNDDQLQTYESQPPEIIVHEDISSKSPEATVQPSQQQLDTQIEEEHEERTSLTEDYVIVQSASDDSKPENVDTAQTEEVLHEDESKPESVSEEGEVIGVGTYSDVSANAESLQDHEPEEVHEMYHNDTEDVVDDHYNVDLHPGTSVGEDGDIPSTAEENASALTSVSTLVPEQDTSNEGGPTPDKDNVHTVESKGEILDSGIQVVSTSDKDDTDDINNASSSVDVIQNEEFEILDENDYNQSTEEADVISADTLPLLESENIGDNSRANDAKVTIEVDGEAIIEETEQPPTDAPRETTASVAETLHNESDETPAIQVQEQADDDQLDDYIDPEHRDSYYEQEPATTPEPDKETLALLPVSAPSAVVGHLDSPSQLIDDKASGPDVNDAKVKTENEIVMVAIEDDGDEQSSWHPEQPMEDLEDASNIDNAMSESAQDTIPAYDNLTPSANGIDVELQDSMATEEYNEDSNMIDME